MNRSPAIYGEDSRRDVYETPGVADVARRSVVALVAADRLDLSDPNDVRVTGPSLGEFEALCVGGAFAEQTVGAFCSGVLIDDDLVLTAGHCMGEGVCPVTRLVFDYYLDAPGQLATITGDAIFGCQRVVAREQVPAFGVDLPPDLPDYAVIQLDRPVGTDRQPVALSPSNSLSDDAALTMIGFPSGIPAKIDTGGRVIDARSSDDGFFSATVDAFRGSSGSPVFDEADTLVGILIAGQEDFSVDEGGSCQVEARFSEADPIGEYVLYASVGIDALCAIEWPSDEQCDAAGVCGDRLCAGDEDSSTCPADCSAPVCGDGLCGEGEVVDCREDCSPPVEWDQCSALFYGTGDGCDCRCGTPDPDCDGPTGTVVFRCNPGQICVADACVDPDDGGCAGAGLPPLVLVVGLIRRRRGRAHTRC